MEQQTMVKELFDDVQEVKLKVSLMYYALMGNDLTKDGGLIKRIDDIEATMQKHDERIEKIMQKQAKLEIYQKLLWAGAGIIFALVLQAVFGIL